MGSTKCGQNYDGCDDPEGADAVVMQEEVTVNEDGTVTFSALPKANQNIRRIGEDVKKGDVVLHQGDELNAVSLPLLASLGIAEVKGFPTIKSSRAFNG